MTRKQLAHEPADFVLTLSFDLAANASRFLDRLA